jgi:peptidoglycan/LPS O-acetylase OafA/YrhL
MSQRLPSLTSLRWFAATAEFLRHGGAFGSGTLIEKPYFHLAPQGAVGVSFFFILSGFVLAWTYRPGDSHAAFYRRRFARIVPVYLVACLGGLFVLTLIEHHHSGRDILTSLIPVTLLQSWIPDSAYYYGGNAVSWSLSSEVFFYALFPIVIVPLFALDRRATIRVLLVVIAVAIAVPLILRPTAENTSLGFWAIYINPLYRFAEFVAGISVCLLLRGGLRLPISAPVAGFLALAAYVAVDFVPIYATWVAVTVIPFTLLIFATAQADLENRPTYLRSPLLVKLGQWSFAFYLVHQMIITTLRRLLVFGNGQLGLLALAYIGSICAAYVLFRFVEEPLERRIRRGAGHGLDARLEQDLIAAGQSYEATAGTLSQR